MVALLDAGTFLAAAAAFALMRLDDRVPAPAGERLRDDLTAGARHILRHRGLRVLLVGCGIVLAVFGSIGAAAYAVVDEGLGRPPTFLGVLSALQGVGSVAGGVSAVFFTAEALATLIGALAGPFIGQHATISVTMYAASSCTAATAVLCLLTVPRMPASATANQPGEDTISPG